MKKFVRGTLMLAECVDDVEAYAEINIKEATV